MRLFPVPKHEESHARIPISQPRRCCCCPQWGAKCNVWERVAWLLPEVIPEDAAVYRMCWRVIWKDVIHKETLSLSIVAYLKTYLVTLGTLLHPGCSRARVHRGAALVLFSAGLKIVLNFFTFLKETLLLLRSCYYRLIKSYQNLQMGLNKCICFFNQNWKCQCITGAFCFTQYLPYVILPLIQILKWQWKFLSRRQSLLKC